VSIQTAAWQGLVVRVSDCDELLTPKHEDLSFCGFFGNKLEKDSKLEWFGSENPKIEHKNMFILT
jgi:hypothetical protein